MARDFVCIELTDELIKAASTRAQAAGAYPGSIRGMAGSLVGFIGEAVVLAWLASNGTSAQPTDGRQNDVEVLGSGGAVTRIEIKTKDRKHPPEGYFDASIPQKNWDYHVADAFVFVSLWSDPTGTQAYSHAFIAGWLTKELFSQRRYPENEGVKTNGANISIACWNVRFASLDEPVGLLGWLQREIAPAPRAE